MEFDGDHRKAPELRVQPCGLRVNLAARETAVSILVC